MKLAMLLIVSLLIGCAGSVTYVPKERAQLKNYVTDRTQRASIGDPIIEVERAEVRPAYRALFDYQTPTVGIQQSVGEYIKRGDRYTVISRLMDSSSTLIIRPEGTPSYTGINITQDGFVKRGRVMMDGGLIVQGKWTKDRLFAPDSTPSKESSFFKAQIIYSGLSSRTLKVSYREFSSDLARPAFSQDLQYNLDESKIISFRSIKIEIVRATNSDIEYKVLSDDGLPWLPK